MKTVQNFFAGKMNRDADDRTMARGEYRVLSNGRVLDTDGSHSGIIESVDGTEEVLKEPFLFDQEGKMTGKILGMKAFEDEIYVIGWGEGEYEPVPFLMDKTDYVCVKQDGNLRHVGVKVMYQGETAPPSNDVYVNLSGPEGVIVNTGWNSTEFGKIYMGMTGNNGSVHVLTAGIPSGWKVSVRMGNMIYDLAAVSDEYEKSIKVDGFDVTQDIVVTYKKQ